MEKMLKVLKINKYSVKMFVRVPALRDEAWAFSEIIAQVLGTVFL